MRVLLQRVSQASVEVDNQVIGSIGNGLLLLVGFGRVDADDSDEKIIRAVEKLINLRIFSNSSGKLDHSVQDIKGEILAVPQFTLYGKSVKGRRPDFTDALSPDFAEPAFQRFCQSLQSALGQPIPKGRFGADMKVHLINNGPLTLQFDF